MKTYEMLYVLDNTIADEAKDTLCKKFEDIVTQSGGSIVSVDRWGAKKLCYPIKFKTEGYYVLMTFESEADVVKELDRIAGITSEVLRRMITVK